jgi:hypothetical protein
MDATCTTAISNLELQDNFNTICQILAITESPLRPTNQDMPLLHSASPLTESVDRAEAHE